MKKLLVTLLAFMSLSLFALDPSESQKESTPESQPTIKLVLPKEPAFSFHYAPNSPAYKWTTQNTILEVLFQTALFIDWKQTRQFLAYPLRHNADGSDAYSWEGNPLLGKYPSKTKVNLMCLGASIGHFIISYFLPESWRTTFQTITLLCELDAINHNYRMGVRISF